MFKLDFNLQEHKEMVQPPEVAQNFQKRITLVSVVSVWNYTMETKFWHARQTNLFWFGRIREYFIFFSRSVIAQLSTCVACNCHSKPWFQFSLFSDYLRKWWNLRRWIQYGRLKYLTRCLMTSQITHIIAFLPDVIPCIIWYDIIL